MNNEQLEKGTKLKEHIEAVEKQLKMWRGATKTSGYPGITVFTTWDNYVNETNTDIVSLAGVPFAVLKALSVQHYQDRLAELKKEYSDL